LRAGVIQKHCDRAEGNENERAENQHSARGSLRPMGQLDHLKKIRVLLRRDSGICR
jgi:hypothetical protein